MKNRILITLLALIVAAIVALPAAADGPKPTQAPDQKTAPVAAQPFKASAGGALSGAAKAALPTSDTIKGAAAESVSTSVAARAATEKADGADAIQATWTATTRIWHDGFLNSKVHTEGKSASTQNEYYIYVA